MIKEVKLDIKGKPEDILDWSIDDFDINIFNYMFGNLGPGKGSRYSPQDTFIIPKGRYYGNKDAIETNIGRYMINKAIIPESIYKEIGFINKRWTGKILEDINDAVADTLMEKGDDREYCKDVIKFLDKTQFYGFALVAQNGTSMSEKTVFLPDKFYKKKEALVKEHKDDINDPDTANKISDELLNYAKEIIGDDYGMEVFNSGAKPSFGNNFKVLNVMKGPIMDLSTGKYVTSTTHYMDGVKKEEVHLFADAMVSGAYARGVGTQIGGYLVKKYMASFQSVVLDERGSKCNTKKTMKVTITKDKVHHYMYRYIKESGKDKILDKETINKYIGKTVDMYDPMFCVNDNICNRCAGDRYYRLNIKNIGLTASRISSMIMNRSLKKFHDATLKIYQSTVTDDLVL